MATFRQSSSGPVSAIESYSCAKCSSVRSDSIWWPYLFMKLTISQVMVVLSAVCWAQVAGSGSQTGNLDQGGGHGG